MLRLRAPLTRLPARGSKVNAGARVAPPPHHCALGSWRARWPGLAVVLSVAALHAVLAEGTTGESVHRPDADCRSCHTAGRDVLERDRDAARTLLAADLEARCMLCHGNEGPSHHTGIRPVKPVPATLPLSGEGLITCATCHFIHGEQNPFGDYVRIDNARGGLCLTCHELSELG